MALIEQLLISLANKIPVWLFTLLGALIEEIIAPIPSPFVMTLAGALTHTAQHPWTYLIFLAIIGAIGKTAGAWAVYAISDRFEDVITPYLGKYFGITHTEIEKLGSRFDKSRKDDIILFAMRALPIMPSSPISFVCGFIKLNIRTFIGATFLGSLVRSFIFLYIGYVGTNTYSSLLKGFDSIESFLQIGIAGVLSLILVWAYLHRRKHHSRPT